MSEKQEEQTFEASLKTLEEAVEQLEAGSLPLSEALKLFEQGLKASNVCRARLEDAKQKVEVLVKQILDLEVVWIGSDLFSEIDVFEMHPLFSLNTPSNSDWKLLSDPTL